MVDLVISNQTPWAISSITPIDIWRGKGTITEADQWPTHSRDLTGVCSMQESARPTGSILPFSSSLVSSSWNKTQTKEEDEVSDDNTSAVCQRLLHIYKRFHFAKLISCYESVPGSVPVHSPLVTHNRDWMPHACWQRISCFPAFAASNMADKQSECPQETEHPFWHQTSPHSPMLLTVIQSRDTSDCIVGHFLQFDSVCDVQLWHWKRF